MINSIFIKKGEAPEVVVVDGSLKGYYELIVTNSVGFYEVNISGVPLYIVYDDNTIESGDAISTVLFYDEAGNVIGGINGSVIITRKVRDDDGEEQCGSLGDGDINMIMARIANNHKTFHLPVYAGEDPHSTSARD